MPNYLIGYFCLIACLINVKLCASLPLSVLFLKKVHSWGGITETVHGSFLLVLQVYSFVSFAPAGVHDLWSSLLRKYTKISLCRELSDMGSEFYVSERL